MKASGTGWYYKWAANGMLMRVVNPEKGIINFGYDPLGRRIWKEAKQKRTCWLWDGNVPLHEWTETEQEPLIDIITWVFEEGTFIPTARITDKGCESIITDYLGTPNAMYDSEGNLIWEADLDIYGRVRTFAGRSLNSCPWRFQGQYFDVETGLAYNRFRYYDPENGNYISQDPIGLAGNNPTLYGYVKDPNSWVDVFGLDCQKRDKKGKFTSETDPDEKSGSDYERDVVDKLNANPNVTVLGTQMKIETNEGDRYVDVLFKNNNTGRVYAAEIKSNSATRDSSQKAKDNEISAGNGTYRSRKEGVSDRYGQKNENVKTIEIRVGNK